MVRFTHSRSTQSTGIHFRITRGGSAIFVGDASGSLDQAATGSHYLDYYNQIGETITYLDSPATTSSTTYTVTGTPTTTTLTYTVSASGTVSSTAVSPVGTLEASRSGYFIALDAIFSPVYRVRYKVENTRVGQITDLDKLILTVDTDGSLSPRDAFEEAAAILVNQYTALAGQTTVESAAPLGENTDSQETTEESAELMTPIEDLNFSARTTNALINNEIHTLKDLFSLSDNELKELKGFGAKALDEVKDKMAEMEL